MDIICIALYIDDNLMMGDAEAIDEVIVILKETGLVSKVMEELKVRLSLNKKGVDWDGPN